MLIVPLTFGSRTKLRPVISATALTTASMSALTKLSVTVALSCAGAGKGTANSATTNAARREFRSAGTPQTSKRRNEPNSRCGRARATAINCRGLSGRGNRGSDAATHTAYRTSSSMIAWPIRPAGARGRPFRPVLRSRPRTTPGRPTSAANPQHPFRASNPTEGSMGDFMSHRSAGATRRLVLGAAFAFAMAAWLLPHPPAVRAASPADPYARIAQADTKSGAKAATTAPAAKQAAKPAAPPTDTDAKDVE